MFSRTVFTLIAVLSFGAPLGAGTYVQFRTLWGNIDVELFDEDKPVTVRNFLRYLQSGRYEASFFHRCPTNPVTGLTDFVLQGGGYFITNGVSGGVITPVPKFAPITNEFGVGRRFSNVYGTLAMAKVAGNTNSATSEWFFNLNDNSFLDAPGSSGYFTVFGRVIRGTNALNQYLGRWLTNGVQDLSFLLGPAFATLPVSYVGDVLPTPNDLEYYEIGTVNLRIKALTNRTHEISFNTLNTNVHRVEYSTNLPPVWHLLVATNGILEPMRVIDPATNSPHRFYRVRIDF